MIDFNYKLNRNTVWRRKFICYCKKANKEYLVGMGQLLDNTFELVEVNQNSAIFRNGNKMYRIDNDEEK